MKYSDRRKTPLKWLNFIKYVWLPIEIIFFVYLFVSMLLELFGLNVLPYFLGPILNIYGLDGMHLGVAFWPIIGFVVLVVVMIYALIEIEKGILKWNKASVFFFNLYNVLTYVLKTTVTVLALIYLKESTLSTVVMAVLVSHGLVVPASFVGYLPLLIMSVTAMILGLLYVGLNIVYFIKRRALFAKDYKEVDETPVQKPSQEVTTKEEQPQPQPEQAVTEGYTQVLSAAIETDTADIKEPSQRTCKHCGATIIEPEAKFCTNCGKSLEE